MINQNYPHSSMENIDIHDIYAYSFMTNKFKIVILTAIEG